MKQNQLINHLNEMIQDFMDKEPIPGLAIGVVSKEETIFAKGFGVKNVNTNEPISEHTLFHMASVSKTFVAMGIMHLVEKNSIDLDSFLIDYLPYFEMKDDRYKTITIRHLLSHISGMPDESDFGWENPQYDDYALERYVRSNKQKELLSSPGESYAYSNIAFDILGDVIHKVSGEYFEQYMKNHVLDKLDMTESHFFKPSLKDEMLAKPHILNVEDSYGPKVSGIFPYHRAHGPSSTLCSNVIEMCQYARTILNQGRYKKTVVLDESAFFEMFKEQGKTNWGEYTSEIGLSWFLGDYKGHRLVSHSGLDTGFRSNLLILPENDIGIVVMTNSDYIGTQVIWKSILDVLLGENVNVKYIQNSLARFLAKTIINEGLNKAYKDYHKIKINLDRYLVIEDELNYVAYELFENKKVNEAIGLLEIAIDIYPESSNLYDSLGEMYLYKGEKELALSHFMSAVKLDPENKEAIRNMESLVFV